MHDNLNRVESAVSATASGNLTWGQWPHDVATALGLSGQRNPLGFAVVRYLASATSYNAMALALQLATSLVSKGADGLSAQNAAYSAIVAWSDIKCPSCQGRGVLNIQQQLCSDCSGTGERNLSGLAPVVRDGISALIEAEQWIEGQLAARLRR